MQNLPQRIVLRQLKLTQFRNYDQIALSFPDKHIVFTGANGAGKTNLLEAVSMLSPGRGMRRASALDIASIGTLGFALHALLDSDGDETMIGLGAGAIVREAEGIKRLKINGTKVTRQDELLDCCRVTWLTPAMDGLFTGPAADRRRFLDRLVLAIEPSHGRQSLDFEKAMRARNRLLSDGVQDEAYFNALEIQMAETGTAIAAARAQTVTLLQDASQNLGEGDGFPIAGLELDGTLEAMIAEQSASDVEAFYMQKLAQERHIDRAAGRTRIGPHRSDLIVTFAAKNMPAALSSTGEQKALLSGLVLSHAQMVAQISGMAPILLLDEVSAHFDTDRRIALFAVLDRLNGQAIMTGTEKTLFDGLGDRAAFYHVDQGQVALMED